MSTNNAWIILIIAGFFEAIWAIGLEYSEGFSKLRPTLITAVALLISMILLANAIQELPVGTAYAVWTGIGASMTALLGIYLFDEPASFTRLFFIFVIVIGIGGLQAVTSS